jgi:PEP-CTERM motif-containing protein
VIWTHVFRCGQWVWTLLTPAAWRSLPHIGKYALVGKTPHLIAGGIGLACAGTIGGGIALAPHVLPVHPGIISMSPFEQSSTPVPEPGTLAILVVAIGALALMRRKA